MRLLVGWSREGASPRGRRNRRSAKASGIANGCISAWAEEPRQCVTLPWHEQVHLRVGGGTIGHRVDVTTSGGASPRGRRNRNGAASSVTRERCISAWAEEPLGWKV